MTGMWLALYLLLAQPAADVRALPPQGRVVAEPPLPKFGLTARHSLPLDVRMVTVVDPYNPPTGLGEGLGTFGWEVSGEGELWDGDPGTLQLRFGTLPNLGDSDNFVAYDQPDFRVALGEQRFSLSPLVRGDTGLGLDAERTLRLTPGLDLDSRVLAYMEENEMRFGVRAGAEFARTEAAVNVLANPAGGTTLLSGQLRLLPHVEGPETLSLEGEYGLQLGAAPPRRGLDVNAELAGGPHSAALSYRRTDAGYGGAPQHNSKLEAEGELRLIDAPEVEVDAGVRLRQEVRRDADSSLSAGSERYNLRVGGTLRGTIRGVNLSLEYANLNDVRGAQEAIQQLNNVDLGVGLPLADGFYLYQSLEWQQEAVAGAAGETLWYSVEADLPALGGNVRPQAGLGYDLRGGGTNAFNVGADYFGLVTDTFNLFAGSGLYVEDGTFFYFVGGGSYGFEDGRALSFNASVFLFGDVEPLVEVSLGYSLPVDVPLGLLSSARERHAREALDGPRSPPSPQGER